jgi:hypothetical protein
MASKVRLDNGWFCHPTMIDSGPVSTPPKTGQEDMSFSVLCSETYFNSEELE